MDLITLDFETTYTKEFTLSKLTTEEYVRDPRFETILCGFKVNDQRPFWVDGPDVAAWLDKLDIANHAVLAHHAHFDGLILSHHYHQYPKVWFDTLSMARAVLGSKGGLGLAKLAESMGLGKKGTEVLNALGKRRADFTPVELANYGGYCLNDVELEYALFQKLLPYFQKSELKVIDLVIRMFTEPMLTLDVPMLEAYVEDIQADKTTALLRAGIQIQDVMSNDKFAAALEFLGVDPPRKLSLTTGRETWAFAKTDPGMEALAEHESDDVQALVAARLKNKTTIAESRALRMIGMAGRGYAPVYLKYSGAGQTHRLSGGDKMNWQNYGRGSKLRKAINAPEGDVCVVADSSNIESRILDWLAMQEDAVEVYRKADNKLGPDTYCVMAEKIYGRAINKKDHPDERQMGKVAKLGLGYGMGAEKFINPVRIMAKKKIDLPFSQLVVQAYRSAHPNVVKLWRRADSAIAAIASGQIGLAIDPRGVVKTCAGGIKLPNGLEIKFPDLQKDADGWSYWNGRSREKIYGAKIVENIVQALARIVVMDQTLDINTYLPVAMSVHDEAVGVTAAENGKDALEFSLNCMRKSPEWGPDLPLNSEGSYHRSYGEAK